MWLQRLAALEGGGYGDAISFGSGENVLRPNVVMDTQLCERTVDTERHSLSRWSGQHVDEISNQAVQNKTELILTGNARVFLKAVTVDSGGHQKLSGLQVKLQGPTPVPTGGGEGGPRPCHRLCQPGRVGTPGKTKLKTREPGRRYRLRDGEELPVRQGQPGSLPPIWADPN